MNDGLMFKGSVFSGVRIIESPFASKRRPRRVHKHRSNQSAAYRARVQKKWTKRFGTIAEPCAYRLADGTLVVHPSIYRQLRTG